MINLENTHPHPTKEKLLFIKIRPKKYFVSTVFSFLPPLRSPIQFQNKSNLVFILWVLYLLSVGRCVVAGRSRVRASLILRPPFS